MAKEKEKKIYRQGGVFKTRSQVLADDERAHSGKPGSSVRHGADALGKPGKAILDEADRVTSDWLTGKPYTKSGQ